MQCFLNFQLGLVQCLHDSPNIGLCICNSMEFYAGLCSPVQHYKALCEPMRPHAAYATLYSPVGRYSPMQPMQLCAALCSCMWPCATYSALLSVPWCGLRMSQLTQSATLDVKLLMLGMAVEVDFVWARSHKVALERALSAQAKHVHGMACTSFVARAWCIQANNRSIFITGSLFFITGAAPALKWSPMPPKKGFKGSRLTH